MRSIVVGGVSSGVGKTTIACALMAAYRRRGHRVQPFKAGPDYIDPSHHSVAAGTESRNLDSVLVPPANLRTLFARSAGLADIAIIEGVMGLFDGRNDRGEEGSTAQIAKLVGAPVVVVIDVARTARSAGAIALGCVRFDPTVRIVGFILNRVASSAHARSASEAIESATGLPVLGSFPRDAGFTLPERHLGLVPTAESVPGSEFIGRLVDTAEQHLDLDRIWALANRAVPATVNDQDTLLRSATGSPEQGARPDFVGLTWDTPDLFPTERVSRHATIAVAQDAAFNFYYADNLDLLRAWGAELAPFSPLDDARLPDGTQGVYLGGGFPEVYAEQLANNAVMRASLCDAAAAGLPIYGECGGLMYLGDTLTDFNGKRHEMAGVLPLNSIMQRRRATLGYRSATALRPSPLLPSGAQTMGHEFHYSELLAPVATGRAAYRLTERDGAEEGYARGNILASYVHLHFGSDPAIVQRFIAACARQQPTV